MGSGTDCGAVDQPAGQRRRLGLRDFSPNDRVNSMLFLIGLNWVFF
jgi:hypothetical protein